MGRSSSIAGRLSSDIKTCFYIDYRVAYEIQINKASLDHFKVIHFGVNNIKSAK